MTKQLTPNMIHCTKGLDILQRTKKMWKPSVKEYVDASNIFKVYLMWSLE